MKICGTEVLQTECALSYLRALLALSVKQRPIFSTKQRPKFSSSRGHFRLFFSLLESEGIIPGFQDIAVMGNAIEQGGGHFGIAEHRDPFRERQVGGDDQGGLFVELADQMEQQGAA